MSDNTLPYNHPTARGYRETLRRHAREQAERQALANACPKCRGLFGFVSTDAEWVECRHEPAAVVTSPSFPDGLAAVTDRTEAEAREQIRWQSALENKARLDRLERALGNTNPIFEFTTGDAA